MKLGVLSNMSDIRKRASFKLFKQQVCLIFVLLLLVLVVLFCKSCLTLLFDFGIDLSEIFAFSY